MKTYLSSLLLGVQFPSSPVHQRRNQKSWRIHNSDKSMYSLYCSQFHTEFLQWMSIHYGSTYHNCHTELLCDPFRTAQLQRPQSGLQFAQYQAPSRDSVLTSSLSPRFKPEAWKRFSHSSHSMSLSDALQYFMHKPHWNLGPGFISISPARMIRINKFVPFEGLKLRRTSAISKFPNSCQALRYSAVGMFVTNPTFLVWTKRNPPHSSISKEWVQKSNAKPICRAADKVTWGRPFLGETTETSRRFIYSRNFKKSFQLLTLCLCIPDANYCIYQLFTITNIH